MAREIYYYLRTPKENKPVVTVCLLEDENERARGLAVCSPLDNPCKAAGRKIAKTRAGWALENGMDNCRICSRNAITALQQVGISAEFFNYRKAAYNPKINHIEMQIMGG